ATTRTPSAWRASTRSFGTAGSTTPVTRPFACWCRPKPPISRWQRGYNRTLPDRTGRGQGQPGATMGFLQGKRALLTGIASERSIASGIAEAMRREGAELAFTYLNDKMRPRVEKAAAALDSDIVLPLDVSSDEQIASCFEQLGQRWDGFDIL